MPNQSEVERIANIINDNVVQFTVRSKDACYVTVSNLSQSFYTQIVEPLEKRIKLVEQANTAASELIEEEIDLKTKVISQLTEAKAEIARLKGDKV